MRMFAELQPPQGLDLEMWNAKCGVLEADQIVTALASMSLASGQVRLQLRLHPEDEDDDSTGWVTERTRSEDVDGGFTVFLEPAIGQHSTDTASAGPWTDVQSWQNRQNRRGAADSDSEKQQLSLRAAAVAHDGQQQQMWTSASGRASFEVSKEEAITMSYQPRNKKSRAIQRGDGQLTPEMFHPCETEEFVAEADGEFTPAQRKIMRKQLRLILLGIDETMECIVPFMCVVIECFFRFGWNQNAIPNLAAMSGTAFTESCCAKLFNAGMQLLTLFWTGFIVNRYTAVDFYSMINFQFSKNFGTLALACGAQFVFCYATLVPHYNFNIELVVQALSSSEVDSVIDYLFYNISSATPVGCHVYTVNGTLVGSALFGKSAVG